MYMYRMASKSGTIGQYWSSATAVTKYAQYIYHLCQHKLANIFTISGEWCVLFVVWSRCTDCTFTSEDGVGHGSIVKGQSVTIYDSSIECRIKI
jgi:hypothetical protein